MFRARTAATFVAVVSLVVGIVVGAAPAGADGTTPVALSCSAPLVGDSLTSVDVTATDSADPVAPGGSVTNTLKVPVPDIGEVPTDLTLREVKITTPIPTGVTVTGVTFTASSLATRTWSVSGGNLVLTLTGSYTLTPGGPPPLVPDVMVATTVGATPRTISWRVPSSITAKVQAGFIPLDASCTPVDPAQVLITTTVRTPNRAPVAADQSVATDAGTAKAITLGATDPDGNALTYTITDAPDHGTLTGTGANRTYTPGSGYVGPDSFVFSASDGTLSDTGTVSITVVRPNTPPAADVTRVETFRGTAVPITYSAADPDDDPLVYTTSAGPQHGVLTGTPPNVTYTPTAGYIGPDEVRFLASDGTASALGSVAIDVLPAPPSAPTITSVVPHAGAARVTWTPPTDDGGASISGYELTPIKGGVPQGPINVGLTTTALVDGLQDGASYTFRVRATTNGGEGVLSAPSAAVTPRTWLPFADATRAVDRLYSWMLGRAPTTAERSLWVARLTAGTHRVGDLVVALRADGTSTGVVDPVVRLYEAYFLRTPDKDGVTYWVAQRRAGASLTKVSDFFARSNEFRTRYGTRTNRQFVELVYQNILGRPGEASGITYWTSQLDSGARSRGSVMIGFSESAEYKVRQRSTVDASVLIIFLEDRTPSASERNALAAQIAGSTLLTGAAAELRTPAVIARATA